MLPKIDQENRHDDFSPDFYYDGLEKKLIEVQMDPNSKLTARERALLSLKQNGTI